MNEFSLLSAFLIGIAGSVHCVAMCGGVVSALSFAIPEQKPVLPYLLGYNLGRIISYTIAGAVTGYAGSIFANKASHGIQILQWLSALFLILMACYVGGWLNWLKKFEQLGGRLWKYIAPVSKRLIPFKHPIYALPYGFIWGWLPCGLVYSTLVWSLASGSMINGALSMLFFGLGTLPALITLGSLGNQIKSLLNKPLFKQAMAGLLVLFALGVVLKSH